MVEDCGGEGVEEEVGDGEDEEEKATFGWGEAGGGPVVGTEADAEGEDGAEVPEANAAEGAKALIGEEAGDAGTEVGAEGGDEDAEENERGGIAEFGKVAVNFGESGIGQWGEADFEGAVLVLPACVGGVGFGFGGAHIVDHAADMVERVADREIAVGGYFGGEVNVTVDAHVMKTPGIVMLGDGMVRQDWDIGRELDFKAGDVLIA